MEHRLVAHTTGDTFHQLRMRNAVEVPAQVRIDHLRVPEASQAVNFPHSVQGTPSFAIRILLRRQVGLEDRLQDQEQSGLHHSVFDRGNPQGPLLAVGLGNPNPPDRLRLILFRSQFLRQFAQPSFHAGVNDLLERLPIDARPAVVRAALPKRHVQYVLAIDLVVQSVEAEGWGFLRFRV
jgi:hypothetical protein